MYNVVLVSGVQQNDSVVHTLLFFRFFSLIGYYKILSRVPCAIEKVFVNYFIHSSVYLLIPYS